MCRRSTTMQTYAADVGGLDQGICDFAPRKPDRPLAAGLAHAIVRTRDEFRNGSRSPTSRVALESFHSAEDVEYYVQCFRRIQLCRDKGLSPEEIAQATGHSLKLVHEYLDLMTRFRIPRIADSQGKEDRGSH